MQDGSFMMLPWFLTTVVITVSSKMSSHTGNKCFDRYIGVPQNGGMSWNNIRDEKPLFLSMPAERKSHFTRLHVCLSLYPGMRFRNSPYP